jgi:hypothetical protein
MRVIENVVHPRMLMIHACGFGNLKKSDLGIARQRWQIGRWPSLIR